MCGGAILAELTRSPPAGRVTAAHVWPQGWVGTDDLEPAFGEFHEDSEDEDDVMVIEEDSEFSGALPGMRRYGLSPFDVIRFSPGFELGSDDFEAAFPDKDSESPVALPRFRRYGLSAFDVIHIRPFRIMMPELFSTFPTTEADDTDAGMPGRASDSVSKALFDAVCFGGVAYEDLESLFSADAVQSKAKAAARLRSFDDRSCRLVQRRRLRVPRQHVQRGRRAEQRPHRRGLPR